MFDGGFTQRVQEAANTTLEGDELIVLIKLVFKSFRASINIDLDKLKNIVLEPKGRYVVKCAIVPGFIKNEWQIWYVEGLEEKFNSSSYVHDKTEDRCEQLNAEHLINLILKELGLKLCNTDRCALSNSIIPCSKGPQCNWPACDLECVGRPGRE